MSPCSLSVPATSTWEPGMGKRCHSPLPAWKGGPDVPQSRGGKCSCPASNSGFLTISFRSLIATLILSPESVLGPCDIWCNDRLLSVLQREGEGSSPGLPIHWPSCPSPVLWLRVGLWKDTSPLKLQPCLASMQLCDFRLVAHVSGSTWLPVTALVLRSNG